MIWLIANGRYVKAKQIIARSAVMNNKTVPRKFRLTQEEEDGLRKPKWTSVRGIKDKLVNTRATQPGKQNAAMEGEQGRAYGFMDLIRSRQLFLYSVALMFAMFVNLILYYGLNLSVGNLAGDVYVNSAISFIIEIPGNIAVAITFARIGRRWPLLVFHAMLATAMFCMYFIPPNTETENYDWAMLLLFFIGKFAVSATYSGTSLFSQEVFPTTLRSIGTGMALTGGRVGQLISPFMPMLMLTMPWLTYIVFGLMAFLCGIILLMMPETLGRSLPDTIEDIEKWTRKVSKEEKLAMKRKLHASLSVDIGTPDAGRRTSLTLEDVGVVAVHNPCVTAEPPEFVASYIVHIGHDILTQDLPHAGVFTRVPSLPSVKKPDVSRSNSFLPETDPDIILITIVRHHLSSIRIIVKLN